MSNIFNKIENLGGVKYLNIEDLESLQDEGLSFVKKIMGNIPESEIIEFTSKFGNSRFIKDVFAKSVNKLGFLQSGKIEIGTIFGWGQSRKSIESIINQYCSTDQIIVKFFPIFDGYPGDIIYYSLEKNSFGKIYYWHHGSDIEEKDIFIASTLDEFIDTFFIDDENDINEKPLSNEELEQINAKRKKVGLSPIDKFKNII
ncbi:SMI1/KNR4 family protein [Chryseobacterium sp. 09-1422]|uniref:SMI1/KNR4 family protein n=1 Tax=Chryseobacterium kimseyorum TaxID=2984028 RepID=A0ABT3HTC4_9FLAO|nr:SMI1/KNR4 family protein [Chryseobacterium kimseyorum]MCW3167040.1 SMI1/KNR4 family protein [Chryseobacterium kimseyorum]